MSVWVRNRVLKLESSNQIFELIYQQLLFCTRFRLETIMLNDLVHGLRTPNEGINQRNLKIWANEADEIGFGRI